MSSKSHAAFYLWWWAGLTCRRPCRFAGTLAAPSQTFHAVCSSSTLQEGSKTYIREAGKKSNDLLLPVLELGFWGVGGLCGHHLGGGDKKIYPINIAKYSEKWLSLAIGVNNCLT